MKGLIIAGEASGDLYGASLATELVSLMPGLRLEGMGGNQMKSAGVELFFDYRTIAVVGVFEVASKLKHLRESFRLTKSAIQTGNFNFAVLIDFPDFNFRVAKVLKENRVPVIYFISPQIWAWRKGRIHFLREHVRKMITILPFEEKIYREAGVPVASVGHPLVEIVRKEVSEQPEFPKPADAKLVGLMPGSRDVEVRRHLPVLIETVNLLRKKDPGIRFSLMWPPSLDIKQYDVPHDIERVMENRYAAMKTCDLILVASGTSTLECAILGVPLFIVYRVGGFSWWLGKYLVKVPYYGLVNWIAGAAVIPEYMQNRMNPGLLSQDAFLFLKDNDASAKMKHALHEIVEKLGPPGAIRRAALEVKAVVTDV